MRVDFDAIVTVGGEGLKAPGKHIGKHNGRRIDGG